MDKTSIKNFAIWARNKLIADITYKAGLLGISEKGIKKPLPQSTSDVQFFDIGTKEPYSISSIEIKQREALATVIRSKEQQSDYLTAYNAVVEEVAYTWFNRLIAVRFMEVNDYLPAHIRVLSSESAGKDEPDLVTNPFDTDLDFTAQEKDYIGQLKQDSQLDELFRMLFIKQCNTLNALLPNLFEKTSDYTELLLNVAFTDKDGVVYRLIHDISEDDFNVSKEGQVEIIGWLYQYYNTEPKDETFALLKKNVKITKERIPSATQLFTPDWIVRYMVENSLGRLWLEGHSNDTLKSEWKYYLDEAEQETAVQKQLTAIREEYKNIKPEDIKVIDPCMGSGHILVYAFDVLMRIYESAGYSQRDAAKSIVENNIYGLDIDNRAYQLAYFAVMMKARQYNRRIINGETKPHIYAIQESNGIGWNVASLGVGVQSKEAKETLSYVLDIFTDAKEYGSILNVEQRDYNGALVLLDEFERTCDLTLENHLKLQQLPLLRGLLLQAITMVQQYDVVVTNPPYMGSSGMGAKLGDFVKENYPNSKSDLFAVFIEKGSEMSKCYGYNCMVTMQSWMFLSSFEKMREKLLTTKIITNLMHMENMVMGIAFGTAVANFRNSNIKGFKGTYNQIKFRDIGNDNQPTEFPVMANRFAQVNSENFSKIPGSPIAYWVSEKFIRTFENPKLGEVAKPRQGMATSDNNRFMRNWYEIEFDKSCLNTKKSEEAILSGKKWFPYNKGGEYRKWYGNNFYFINWENDGLEIKKLAVSLYKCVTRTIKNIQFYFNKGVTWTTLSTGSLSARYSNEGFLFDTKGSTCFFDNDEIINYTLAFMNCSIVNSVLAVLAPTVDYNAGSLAKLPIIIDEPHKPTIDTLVEENISISKTDWDSSEISWDFKKHPLIKYRQYNALCGEPVENEKQEFENNGSIELSFKSWQTITELQFTQLKQNEEELNRIFIEIYGLQDELTPEVADKDVTIRKADLTKDIKSFISYAVGCMFGRYSLDVDGLAYAGGAWSDSKYHTFIPDKDNVIPITDEEYFEDDIVGLFVAFVKKVYGAETLEENLDFIANALGNRGNTSRQIIRNYFLKDFFNNHCKIYKKRPIYWLFDSGKADGFKALIYMHRYDENTIGNLRVDYLHKMQRIYEREIIRMQETIDNSTNAREVAEAEKRKDKLTKQLKEAMEYDAKIAHLALARIAIDLDDGVKVNYEKVQTGKDGKKLEVLAKI